MISPVRRCALKYRNRIGFRIARAVLPDETEQLVKFYRARSHGVQLFHVISLADQATRQNR
jgi:hypothetical protein